MYFFGAISNSQVAINNGMVTQTMVKDFAEPCPSGTAPAAVEPPGRSLSEGSVPPHERTWNGQSAVGDSAPDVEPISAEAVCRRHLQPMLDELRRRIPELGISSKAQRTLEQTIVELHAELRCTPIDMRRVDVGLERIRNVLAEVPQGVVSSADDLHSSPTRGGAP
ncbi:hypothetical protein [Streptomyces sp. NPDC057199]|uniref:hypothetical protein n=1 Tax=Streptomyces sp. NPDC057199 TaxID=3346047 RepID=UPI00363AD23A